MQLQDVSVRFGDFYALKNLSFDLAEGEILGVAGPNGAGKSTLLNVCAGGLIATNGQVLLGERDITRLKRHQRCDLGITQTFQIPTLLSSVSVGENLLAGHMFGQSAKDRQAVTSIAEIVDLVRLEAEIDRLAGEVDLLTRKRVMLGAALATAPKILFMDEPLGGLNSEEIEKFLSAIRTVRETLGITVVMVEHKTRSLAEVADRILIINFGEFVMMDVPEKVLNDDHVVEIYLGKKHSA